MILRQNKLKEGLVITKLYCSILRVVSVVEAIAFTLEYSMLHYKLKQKIEILEVLRVIVR